MRTLIFDERKIVFNPISLPDIQIVDGLSQVEILSVDSLHPAGFVLPLNGAKHELTRAIGLTTKQEIKKGQFVDMITESKIIPDRRQMKYATNWPQINISVCCHGVVRFLSENGQRTIAQLASVQERGVEQLQLLLKTIKLGSY